MKHRRVVPAELLHHVERKERVIPPAVEFLGGGAAAALREGLIARHDMAVTVFDEIEHVGHILKYLTRRVSGVELSQPRVELIHVEIIQFFYDKVQAVAGQ